MNNRSVKWFVVGFFCVNVGLLRAADVSWVYHEDQEVLSPINYVLENAEQDSISSHWQGSVLRESFPDGAWGVSFEIATYSFHSRSLQYYRYLVCRMASLGAATSVTLFLETTHGQIWRYKEPLTLTESPQSYAISLTSQDWQYVEGGNGISSYLKWDLVQNITFQTDLGRVWMDDLQVQGDDFVAEKSDVESSAAFSLTADEDVTEDATGPLVSWIDIYPNINGRYSARPMIRAQVRDPESGIATWNIEILRAQTEQVVQSQQGQGGSERATLNVEFNVTTPLEEDQYVVRVSALNTLGMMTVTQSASLLIAPILTLENALVGPNPFNPNKGALTIQYTLSKSADMHFYMMSISGEKIWEYGLTSGGEGAVFGDHHSVKWDGVNRYGEQVANGVYVLYIVAETGQEKQVSKVKVMVLK